MSFDPKEFLNIACQLPKDTEATIRTCIGRAYYAAFLFARERTKQKFGIQYPKSGAAHQKVSIVLGNNGLTGSKIQLDTLRNERHKADYDLTIPCNKTDAEKAILLAENIINDLQ